MMTLLTNTHTGRRVAMPGKHRNRGFRKLFGKWDHEDVGYMGKHRAR